MPLSPTSAPADPAAHSAPVAPTRAAPRHPAPPAGVKRSADGTVSPEGFVTEDLTSDRPDARRPAPWSEVRWLRVSPFFVIQLACLAVFFVGWSPVAVGVCVALYVARMFAITAFYHRYFSHRSFRTSRVVQFLFGLLGNASAQRGPLWWAAHHRHHHRDSDTVRDVHSPLVWGFWWSHMFWITTKRNFSTDMAVIPDFARFRELRWLERFDWVAPLALLAGCFGLGELLASVAPSWGTTGWQMVVWGFCVSTTLLYHGTFTINSLAHVWGKRRYETGDGSRNNFFLALITLGEGWHNNHHRYPHAVRQGFLPHEIDLSHLVLSAMAKVGLVWDLRPVPAAVIEEGRGR